MTRCKAARILVFFLGLAVLLAFGCQKGQPYYPVHGQVLVDGQPAEGALVVFHPTDDMSLRALRPSAIVQADGSFSVRSYDPDVCPTPKDGAPAGDYFIAINWYPPGVARSDVIPDRLHNRYGNPTTSGLCVQVKEELNQLPAFELTAKKKR
jgi:hypothetical protein